MKIRSVLLMILTGFTPGISDKVLADIGLFNTQSNEIVILCSRDDILISKSCEGLPISLTCNDPACAKSSLEYDLSEYISALASDTGPYKLSPDDLKRIEYAISISEPDTESYAKLLVWKSNLVSWLQIIDHLEESYVGPAITENDMVYSKLIAGLGFHDEVTGRDFYYAGVHSHEGARRACEAIGDGWKLPDGEEILGMILKMAENGEPWDNAAMETPLGSSLLRMLRRDDLMPSRLISSNRPSQPIMRDQLFFSDYRYTSQGGTDNCMYFYKSEGLPSGPDHGIYLRAELSTNCAAKIGHAICMRN